MLACDSQILQQLANLAQHVPQAQPILAAADSRAAPGDGSLHRSSAAAAGPHPPMPATTGFHEKGVDGNVFQERERSEDDGTCRTEMVCVSLTVGQPASRYSLVRRALPWDEARRFCQSHYVDLAVLSSEEQYHRLRSSIPLERASFWLGMQRRSVLGGWTWVNGERLSYDRWYRENYEGLCASLEAVLVKNKNMLARHCGEHHSFVCQGPTSPQQVKVKSLGTNDVTLSWGVSAFMQTTPHRYNVTVCGSTCEAFLYPYAGNRTSMAIVISNLTAHKMYVIRVAAAVTRPGRGTGVNITLQSDPTALTVRTAAAQENVILILLKLLKVLSLIPPLWVLYRILRRRTPVEPEAELCLEDVAV